MANSARQKLKRQWPFLQSICNGGWFKPLLFGQPPNLESVCDEELDGDEKDSNWPLISASHRRKIEAKLARFLEESGPLPELTNARPIYDQNEQTKKENKALRFKLRSEHNLPDDVTFAQYHQANFADAAWLLIHRPRGSGQLQMLAALDQPEAKLEAWKRGPAKFAHFTAFVGFWIYSLFDAEKNQNSPLDRNWQSDAEQLCFLVDVDAMGLVRPEIHETSVRGSVATQREPFLHLSPFSPNSKGRVWVVGLITSAFQLRAQP
jgi:hypothetical protein